MEAFEFEGISGVIRSSNPFDEIGDITKPGRSALDPVLAALKHANTKENSVEKELTPHEQSLLEVHKLGIQFSALQAQLCDVLLIGLQTDGAHHKQWALWRIAEIASVAYLLSDIEDKGIKP